VHRPGVEVAKVTDPAVVLWEDRIDQRLAGEQHDVLAALYESHGVEVLRMEPGDGATPNLFFARDHFFMTPEGAVVSRMGSDARAGEERHSVAALTAAGVPILATVHGDGTFEGADVFYLADGVVLVGCGMRSNPEGCRQVAGILSEIGFEPVIVDLPYGTGHLDGTMSLVDERKAMIRPYHLPYSAYRALGRLGYTLLEIPDEAEVARSIGINVVPLAPGVVVMPAGNPQTKRLLEGAGVECLEVEVDELMKGCGSVHCMTGVVQRDAV
jgi:N-dimethylarginine dimethylaminohydrolase